VLLAFFATLFALGITALGSLMVFFFKKINKKILTAKLGFAAGAMIFVVVEEIIPEAQTVNETDLSTIGVMVGFAVMMLLEVALGKII